MSRRTILLALVAACTREPARGRDTPEAGLPPHAAATTAADSIRSGAPAAANTPAATPPAAAPAALPPTVIADANTMLGACEAIETALHRMPGLRTKRGFVPLDSAWSGAGNRPSCRISANGHSVRKYYSMDSLEAWMRASGWRDNTNYQADGPDGTVYGLHHAGVTCILEGRWDGGDDSDSTYVPSDTLTIFGTCTTTVAADTTQPR
jgi:hypothetical protein